MFKLYNSSRRFQVELQRNPKIKLCAYPTTSKQFAKVRIGRAATNPIIYIYILTTRYGSNNLRRPE